MEAIIFPAFPTLIQKFRFEGDNEHLQNVVLGISKFENVDPHLSGYSFLEKYKDHYNIIDEFLTFSQKCAETFFADTLRYKRERMICVNSWVNTLRSLVAANFDSADSPIEYIKLMVKIISNYPRKMILAGAS